MVETLLLVAVALLVAGVLGTLVPLVPGALLSLVGVYVYWWGSGYSEPGLVVLVGLTVLGVLTLVVDYFAGAISAKAGGASWTTSAVAGVAGLLLFFVAGPLGVIAGVAGTVFALEYRRNDDPEASAKAALYTTVGMLGSTVVQALLTLTMLGVFVVTVVV